MIYIYVRETQTSRCVYLGCMKSFEYFIRKNSMATCCIWDKSGESYEEFISFQQNKVELPTHSALPVTVIEILTVWACDLR